MQSNLLLLSAPILAIVTILMLNTISSYLNMGDASTRYERSLNAPSEIEEREKMEEGEVSIARRGDNLHEHFAYTVPKEIEGERYVNNILPYIIGVTSASVTFIVLNRLKISRV